MRELIARGLGILLRFLNGYGNRPLGILGLFRAIRLPLDTRPLLLSSS